MSARSLPVRNPRATALRPAASLFGSLQQEIDRLFEEFREFRGFGNLGDLAHAPNMDLSETDDAVELTVELPGLEMKDVDISVSDDVLTVKGEKRAETEEKTKTYKLVERTYGAFSRSIQLPPGVDPAKIKATLANGVLKVTAPKPAKPEAKKIPVQAAA